MPQDYCRHLAVGLRFGNVARKHAHNMDNAVLVERDSTAYFDQPAADCVMN